MLSLSQRQNRVLHCEDLVERVQTDSKVLHNVIKPGFFSKTTKLNAKGSNDTQQQTLINKKVGSTKHAISSCLLPSLTPKGVVS